MAVSAAAAVAGGVPAIVARADCPGNRERVDRRPAPLGGLHAHHAGGKGRDQSRSMRPGARRGLRCGQPPSPPARAVSTVSAHATAASSQSRKDSTFGSVSAASGYTR